MHHVTKCLPSHIWHHPHANLSGNTPLPLSSAHLLPAWNHLLHTTLSRATQVWRSAVLAIENMEDLSMEHGFLKAPWEVLVRKFRAGHKPLAKELELFSSAVAKLVEEASGKDSAVRDNSHTAIREQNLLALETKLTGLKRKLDAVRTSDEEAMRRCYYRIRLLRLRSSPPLKINPNSRSSTDLERMEVEGEQQNDTSKEAPASANGVDPSEMEEDVQEEEDETARNEKEAEAEARWEKLRLDRALVDYMLREGMYETAESLAQSHKLQQIVDTEIFRESRIVIEALRRRDCTEGLKWCSDNKRRLQKVHSKLEFRLRLQEFVEHARAGRKQDAIKYMKKHLSTGHCDQERMCDIQRFMALLAFDPTTSCQPYKDMYSERKWLELEHAFKQDNYRLHGLTRESTIEILLKAGLASLKTRKCGTEADRKPNCPTCVEPYLSLAQSLPRGRHENSTLVCSISGEIMDENNPPMALPNGNVYSEKALKKLASENDGVIIDPRTQDKARLDELRKCFIM